MTLLAPATVSRGPILRRPSVIITVQGCTCLGRLRACTPFLPSRAARASRTPDVRALSNDCHCFDSPNTDNEMLYCG